MLEYASGTIYDGEWVDNMKHGTGTYFYALCAMYSVEWADDVMHDKGTWQAEGLGG